MTTLGNPGLSFQSLSGFSGREGPKNLETEWDDTPGKPGLVIPIHFGLFWPKRATKHPTRTWMTTLERPGQSVSGFSGRKGPKNLEVDWDDNPGKPMLVIPVRFEVFWPKRAKKPRNGLG